MLQIKPILTLREGRVEPFQRERTHKNAVARLKQLVLEEYPRREDGYLSIMHAAAPSQAQMLASDLQDRLGLHNVPILDVPPAIVTHGGPGILAAAFFTA
jgi:fatty acid-binding protein DegV